MTAAIRETVIDYSKPSTPLKRPFSATHIARNIRAQQLSTVSEESSNSQSSGSDNLQLPQASEITLTSDPSSRNSSPNPSAGTSGLSLDASPETSPTTTPSNSNSSKSLTANFPDAENITADTITSHTFTAGMPPLDLLIRTSGVERLSDFMLWQCHQSTEIVFLDCLWPEFDLWKFVPVLVEWQWRRRHGVETELGRGRKRNRAGDIASNGTTGVEMSGERSFPSKVEISS